MNAARLPLCLLALLGFAETSYAQTPPAPAKEPPPLGDVQLGASFVGTGGNSDTRTFGSDFSLHRRWPLWKLEAAATAVSTTDRGEKTAERYLAALRGDRKLTDRIDFSTGERAEWDRLA